MGVDTHVARCTGQRLPLAVGDMLLGLGVTVLFGHAKIDHVDYIGGFGVGTADEEVVGFDITVDEILLMDRLDSGKLGVR